MSYLFGRLHICTSYISVIRNGWCSAKITKSLVTLPQLILVHWLFTRGIWLLFPVVRTCNGSNNSLLLCFRFVLPKSNRHISVSVRWTCLNALMIIKVLSLSILIKWILAHWSAVIKIILGYVSGISFKEQQMQYFDVYKTYKYARLGATCV